MLLFRYFIEAPHPSWGDTKMVGFPWDFSETPAAWSREAPALGQHTDEVLTDLGYRKEDIENLRGEGVIQSGELPSLSTLETLPFTPVATRLQLPGGNSPASRGHVLGR